MVRDSDDVCTISWDRRGPLAANPGPVQPVRPKHLQAESKVSRVLGVPRVAVPITGASGGEKGGSGWHDLGLPNFPRQP